MRLSKLQYFGIGIIVILLMVTAFFFSRPTRIKCGLGMERLTVSRVAYGCFVEYTPQTGFVEIDTFARCHSVKVPVDELYLTRMKPGLTGRTTLNNKEYMLSVTYVDPGVKDGRFSMEMNFCDEIPPDADGSYLRLRIELSDSSTQLLLPVGGFYKDTGGDWIYVVENENRVVRRNIKLGRKSGAEYFEVLEGLEPGDNVIISSYENFERADSLDPAELRELLSPLKI